MSGVIVPAGARVLVTGASGFIGRHVAARLAGEGYTVLGLDRAPAATPGVPHYTCDLLDADELRRSVADAAPDAILHLGARCDLNGARLADYAANVDGVRHLVAAIRERRTVRRAVCTSTQLVCRPGYLPSHDTDYRPHTAYGESKVHTERIWREADGGGTEWCLVRPTTIWGPHMNPHYQRLFAMIRAGRYVHISGGPRPKSYGYVGNTAFQYQRLIEAAADRIHRRTFYLADYRPLVLEEWTEQFRAALEAPPIRTIPRPLAAFIARVGDVVQRSGWSTFPFTTFRLNNVLTSYIMDLSATESVCGALPYDLAGGVAETVSWLRTLWNGKAAALALQPSSGSSGES